MRFDACTAAEDYAQHCKGRRGYELRRGWLTIRRAAHLRSTQLIGERAICRWTPTDNRYLPARSTAAPRCFPAQRLAYPEFKCADFTSLSRVFRATFDRRRRIDSNPEIAVRRMKPGFILRLDGDGC
jgi:hypothetical protein